MFDGDEGCLQPDHVREIRAKVCGTSASIPDLVIML